AVVLAREMAARRIVPQPRPRVEQTAGKSGETAPARGADPIATYNVVAARNLFSPTRSEAPAPAAATPSAPPAPKPILHGVIVDENNSRAWLEDPATKRTFGYAVGDTVGGGRLESIANDRVVITRSEGRVEVLLRDPSKPRPPVPAAVPAPGA